MADNQPEMICGGIQQSTDFKAVELELNKSLSKLAAGDGPNYKLVKIYSATTQVVAGSLTKCVADLEDAEGKIKKCNISIWSRTWLPDGIEVTIECEGEDTLVRKHSP